ncbi:hypothetical protein K438DRAFT_1671621 [Mycena galopus ATCC 62051]|nr:hypothetical protein K438DRAFT_1671621 [Mycena galopus ATCC 62051]
MAGFILAPTMISIHLQDILIKSLSNPHDDLPPDMRMSAQLIVDGEIFLQMMPVKSEISQNPWRLSVDCQIPQHALNWVVAIIRHSEHHGTRLLGSIDMKTDQVIISVEQNTRTCGPTLRVAPHIHNE